MVRRLGDRILPESLAGRRRQVQERLRELRRPVRRFREDKIPGPDLVGSLESQALDLRDKVVSRDTVVDRIRKRRASNGNNSGSSNGGSGQKTEELT